MKKLLLILLVAVMLAAESRVTLWGAGLNLTVLVAYWTGLRHGAIKGTLVGAMIGAVTDSISGGILGPSMLSKATVGYLGSYLRGGLFMWTPVLGAMAVFFLTAMDGFMAHACYSVFSQRTGSLDSVAKVIFLQAVLNLWVGFLLRPEDERD